MNSKLLHILCAWACLLPSSLSAQYNFGKYREKGTRALEKGNYRKALRMAKLAENRENASCGDGADAIDFGVLRIRNQVYQNAPLLHSPHEWLDLLRPQGDMPYTYLGRGILANYDSVLIDIYRKAWGLDSLRNAVTHALEKPEPLISLNIHHLEDTTCVNLEIAFDYYLPLHLPNSLLTAALKNSAPSKPRMREAIRQIFPHTPYYRWIFELED